MSFEAILFLIIAVDAIVLNILAYTRFGPLWTARLSFVGAFFPITKGWAFLYFLLVCWLGLALLRLDLFVF